MNTARTSILILLVIAGGGSALGDAGIGDDERSPGKAITSFACRLFDEIRGNEGNLFFSPLGITSICALTYAGSDGKTKQEFEKLFGFDAIRPAVHEFLHDYTVEVQSRSDGGSDSFYSANRLWLRKDLPLTDGFRSLGIRYYHATMGTLNPEDPLRSRFDINRWVKSRTDGLIPEAVPPQSIDRETVLVAVNAIYFEGRWRRIFLKSRTKPGPFHVTGADSIEVAMMHRTGTLSYYRAGECGVLKLDYSTKHLSMIVVLPHEREGLGALEESLTGDSLNLWLARMSEQRVEVAFPRFTIDHRVDLQEALVDLGLGSLFDPVQANLRRLSPEPGVFVSDLLHRAFVRTNEEGTKAAASTSSVVSTSTSMGKRSTPVPFHADHPFLFVIWDHRAGLPLFLGRVVRPDGWTAGRIRVND